MGVREDLNEEFGNFCINVNDSTLEKCVSLCGEFCLSAEDLVYGWVAYAADSNRTKVTVARLEAMVRAKLLRHTSSGLGRTTSSSLSAAAGGVTSLAGTGGPEVHTPKIYTRDSIDRQSPLVSLKKSSIGGPATTPKRYSGTGNGASPLPSLDPARPTLFSPTSYSPASAVSCERYVSRSCRGDVVASYGSCSDHLAAPTAAAADDGAAAADGDVSGGAVHVQLSASSCSLCTSYGYMFETLQETASLYSEHILQLGQLIREQRSEAEDVRQPHAVSQEPVYAVGCVRCDGQGRLNSGSLLLSGGQGVYGQARCVHLDVSQVDGAAVFPGQVVLVRGVNPTGSTFYASELFSSALPPFASPPDLSRSVCVMAACGPFTTVEDLQYDPLRDLLTEVRSRRPHVLLLQGPFIDSRIVQSELAETYDELWQKLLQLIDDQLAGLETRVLLQSSVTDLHTEPVFPTPAFAAPTPPPPPAAPPKQSLAPESRALPLMLPSPASLLVSCQRQGTEAVEKDKEEEKSGDGSSGGVLMAAMSIDVLMHLSQQELKIPGSGSSDRLARLCSYLLQQRCYYPLFPSDESLGLDVRHWRSNCSIHLRPHLLFLPSDFRGFVKEVHGTVIVNPSRLVRGSSGGTYAVVDISPDASADTRLSISAQILKI